MAPVKTHGRRRASVSASELAQMGVCERMVVFEHRYGKRRTVEQQQAIKRGQRAHLRFYRDGHMDWTRRWRYFIVFLIFGRWLTLCVAKWFQVRKPRHEN